MRGNEDRGVSGLTSNPALPGGLLDSESDIRRFTDDGACLTMSEGVARRLRGFLGLLFPPPPLPTEGPTCIPPPADTTLVMDWDMAVAYIPALGAPGLTPDEAFQALEAGGCIPCACGGI